MRPCDCTGPGFCERHQVFKTAKWVTLCQASDAYWQAWEEGHGPGQKISRDLKTRKPGPGTRLKNRLAWFGVRATEGCKCNKRANAMDRWGPAKCRENMDTILGWLEEESKARKLPFFRSIARLLVLSAIEACELEESQHSVQ